MLPNAQPRPRPRVFDKRESARDKLTKLRSVYAIVSERDKRQCRCCGRKDGLHHHHVVWRSMGGKDTRENLVLLCAGCHGLVHARQIGIEGSNADERLIFEIHEAAVKDVFGNKVVPRDVRIVTARRG